jgi:hypothetical protein
MEIDLHALQLREHKLDFRRIDSGEDIGHQVSSEHSEPLDHRARSRRQEQALNAPIFGVGPAFDKPARA